MMPRFPAALFVFLLALAPAVWAAEKTAVGDVCSGDQSRADWDAIFQCVSSQFKRAALWLGSSSDTCDSTKAGLLQWTGTGFQGCDSSNWTSFASGNAPLYLGTSTASTNPRRADDATTGLFSATASTVGVAVAGVEALRVTASGSVGIGIASPLAKLNVWAGSTGQTAAVDAIIISGPNSPTSSAGAQGLSWNFVAAGSAKIRAYRGGNWDTYLQFLTNAYNQESDSPQIRMHIDHVGNIGIGTTAPSTKLHVVSTLPYGTAVSDVLRLSGNYSGGTTSNPSTVGSIAWTDEYYSTIFGRINVVQDNPYASDHSHMEFWTRSDGTAAEKVRITNAGYLSVGTTSPSYLLHVNGTAYATGAAGALSDARHKNNVKSFSPSGLEIVAKLRPVTFEWKEPKDNGMKGAQIGFIAQEVEKVLPQVVLTEKNAEKTKGLKYTEIIPVLTKAIQELNAVVEAQGRELRELKAARGE